MRSNMPYVIYQDCYSFINLNKKLKEEILCLVFSFRSIAVVLTTTPSQTMMTMSGSLILLSIMSWSEAELLLLPSHRS